VQVEAAREWVGPLPGDGVADDVEARALLEQQEAVERVEQRGPGRGAVVETLGWVAEEAAAASSERGMALTVRDVVVTTIQRLQTVRQRSTDSDGRRTRISVTASSHSTGIQILLLMSPS
jgi:hypothetical protein